MEPWSKQREILESVRDHPRTAVASCTGRARRPQRLVALWFLCVFPQSRVVTTAPTTAQLRDVLWREIAQAHRESRGLHRRRAVRHAVGDRDRLVRCRARDRPAGPLPGLPRRAPAARRGRGGRRRRRDLRGSLRVPDQPRVAYASDREPDPRHRASSSTRSIRSAGSTTGSRSRRSTARRSRARRCRARSPGGSCRRSGSRSTRGSGGRDRRCGRRGSRRSSRASADDTVVSLGELEAAQQRELEPGLPLVVACRHRPVRERRDGDRRARAATWCGSRRAYSGKDTMKTSARSCASPVTLEREHGRKPLLVVDDAGLGGGVDRPPARAARVPGRAVPRRGRVQVAGVPAPPRRELVWLRRSCSELDLPADEELAADLLAPRYSLDSAGPAGR